MTPRTIPARGAEFAAFALGGDSAVAGRLLVWAPGWGQSHNDLLPLAESVRRCGRSLLLDPPGFGAAPPPPGWSTADYADAAAECLAGMPAERRIWVAHSFGCRIGLQLAARHPKLVDALFLIAAPGLRPRRSPAAQAMLLARRSAFRIARTLTPDGPARERLRERFGSADYRRADRRMRAVLVQAVNEDLSAPAAAVRCPALLVYGDRDRETPPDIGMRLNRMMQHSRLVVLRGFGHLDIVTE
ncbi:MAG TPA: alpha/beta fold hydrolase, partial [Stellaceae bacterium]|nr:alpha/beta fold hydrolase [Stellaceae bacterium]